MNAVKTLVGTVKGLWSLVVGLSITGRFLASPIETVHYPRRVVDPEVVKSYRGPVELIHKEGAPGETKCISCQMCVKACPSGCLTVKKSKESKAPEIWISDFSLCSLCGSCVEVCPADAIRYSHNVYWTVTDRKDLKRDLLADLKQRAAKKSQN